MAPRYGLPTLRHQQNHTLKGGNMRYGKLENGNLVYAPSPLIIDGIKVWTNVPSVIIGHGYKPISNTTAPYVEGYYQVSGWAETDTEIVQTWTAHAIPVDETADMQSALNEAGITPVEV